MEMAISGGYGMETTLWVVTPAHEKDFRSISVFPICEAEEARLVVLRADYRGGLVVEAVQGSRWQPGGWDIVTFIWKGHMTLLQPPDGLDLQALLEREDHVCTPAMFGYIQDTTSRPRRRAGSFVVSVAQAGRQARALTQWL